MAAPAAGLFQPVHPVVRSLECLRGISTLTAFGLAVEIGDWDGFTGSTIGACLGLVPTDYSGQSRSQGLITKAGNTHARRLLVEAGPGTTADPTHTRPRYVRARWEHATPAAKARDYAVNRRRHERWLTYLERKKRPVIANVAIARELAGWCWWLANHRAGMSASGSSFAARGVNPRQFYEQPAMAAPDL